MIDFNIIHTGSLGNAVVINEVVLIDCGVPFKMLKGVYKKLKLVLLTHIHKDHFNKETLRRLAYERPTLRFGAPEWLVKNLVDCGVKKKNIDVLKMDWKHNYRQFEVVPVLLRHNVPNCGYKVHFEHGKMIYATDTNSMDGITAENYDLYLIEGNYTEQEINERIRDKLDNGGFVYEFSVLNNHLSKEKALDWLYENMGAKSKYMFIHEHVGRRVKNE